MQPRYISPDGEDGVAARGRKTHLDDAAHKKHADGYGSDREAVLRGEFRDEEGPKHRHSAAAPAHHDDEHHSRHSHAVSRDEVNA